MITRRTFLQRGSQAIAVATLGPTLATAAASRSHQMKLDLNFSKMGMSCDQRQAIEFAANLGFQSVGVADSQIAKMSDAELDELNTLRRARNLVWGTSGCPVDFRRDDDAFATSLKQMTALGPKLRRLGVTRMTTWISPASSQLTYRKNFELHVERMKRINDTIAPHDVRLGLEYVGTQLGRFNRKHSFIHTSAEILELIEACDATHLGVIVDSWHWWTSGEDVADLQRLTGTQIVSVELNDAPENLAREQQIDNQRRLPVTTGVIPMKEFLSAIAGTGFEGPVYTEPFYAPLRKEPVELAAEQAAAAMKRAFALVS